MKHAPDLHSIPEAPGLTFTKAAQSWPHVPQFLPSVMRSTQVAPQRSVAGAMQLALHPGSATAIEQSGVGPSHFVPQPPQFCESKIFVSQPSSGRDEQCANPAAQEPGGTKQVPALHSMPTALKTTFGNFEQS
ncbi:MAG TPA: hypothetical protein VH374_17685 [Polyangia bacterium]|nr:hypothetical protein [Polyangia bacterium]